MYTHNKYALIWDYTNGRKLSQMGAVHVHGEQKYLPIVLWVC